MTKKLSWAMKVARAIDRADKAEVAKYQDIINRGGNPYEYGIKDRNEVAAAIIEKMCRSRWVDDNQ